MYNYVRNAHIYWNSFSYQFKMWIGDRFVIEAMFVNGDLINTDYCGSSERVDSSTFTGNIPRFVNKDDTGRAEEGYAESFENFLSNIFHILKEDTEGLFKMIFRRTRTSQEFYVTVLDINDDIVIETRQKLLWQDIL